MLCSFLSVYMKQYYTIMETCLPRSLVKLHIQYSLRAEFVIPLHPTFLFFLFFYLLSRMYDSYIT